MQVLELRCQELPTRDKMRASAFSGMAWSLKAAEGQGIDGSRINEASILVDHERTGS